MIHLFFRLAMSHLCSDINNHYNNFTNFSAIVPTLECILSVYIQAIICIIGILLNSMCFVIFSVVTCLKMKKVISPLLPYLITLTSVNTIQLLLTIPLIVLYNFVLYLSEMHGEKETNFLRHRLGGIFLFLDC